jgi:hydrogenase maturation factor
MCLGEIGVVTAVDRAPDAPTATVRVRESDRTASLLLRPDVEVGQHVVLHTGYVVEVLDPSEAASALELREHTR